MRKLPKKVIGLFWGPSLTAWDYLSFLGSIKKLGNFILIFMEWIGNDIYRSEF
jgi:hypothetical protein